MVWSKLQDHVLVAEFYAIRNQQDLLVSLDSQGGLRWGDLNVFKSAEYYPDLWFAKYDPLHKAKGIFNDSLLQQNSKSMTGAWPLSTLWNGIWWRHFKAKQVDGARKDIWVYR